MSVMEISHRSALYKDLYAETKANLLELMKLDPAEYDVIFLSGGATQHRIAVVDSGHWAQRAAEDAAKVPGLTVDIVASAKDNNYTAVPKIPTEFDQDYDYLHITTNNTIMGTAYRDDQIPKTDIPLVADMSSNFLGQEYDYSKFAVISTPGHRRTWPLPA